MSYVRGSYTPEKNKLPPRPKTEITGPIFGAVEPKPLRGFPKGRIKLRIRNYGFVMAYVKTDTEIRQYAVGHDTEGYWRPYILQGVNKKGEV